MSCAWVWRLHLVHERFEALPHPLRFELVAQDGRQRQRQRRALVEQVEQRQIAAGDRLPQPLLAKRPRAKTLHIGHVRVQDDGQLPLRVTTVS